MKGSPHFKTFEGDANKWEAQLTEMRTVMDLWVDVQRRWKSMDGIFNGSSEIQYQVRKLR